MGKVVLLALALGALAPPAAAADDLIASEMVDQAREWQQKDRDDLAAEIWRKLLRANPKHPEALVKLGGIEARAGNLKKAKELYSRATSLAQPPAGLNQLSAALDSFKENSADLALPLAGREPRPISPAPAKSVKLAVPLPVPSKPRAQMPATSASPKPDVNEKPAQKAKADALNLKFSNSMGIAR